MDIAQVDGTLEFTLSCTPNRPTTNQKTSVDLNETPFKINEEHIARINALARTGVEEVPPAIEVHVQTNRKFKNDIFLAVELGKRFFPRCSEVLNKIMDDDYSEIASLGQDASEEKRKRYLELQDVLTKAFSEDKEEFDRSAMSSSSSTSRSRI